MAYYTYDIIATVGSVWNFYTYSTRCDTSGVFPIPLGSVDHTTDKIRYQCHPTWRDADSWTKC